MVLIALTRDHALSLNHATPRRGMKTKPPGASDRTRTAIRRCRASSAQRKPDPAENTARNGSPAWFESCNFRFLRGGKHRIYPACGGLHT